MDRFNYVISLDLGTTFSGSCYSNVEDKKRIVHVVRWPEQSENDTFEKTPTACLYETIESSPRLIKWGKAAYEHVLANPNDPNLLFIDQFKLKLHSVFKQQDNQSEWNTNIYVLAAIDYLREIHKYTCEQLIQNDANATPDQFKYVLTVPATWVDRDTSAMRTIAVKAGIIDQTKDPQEKLVILSEAHAASLFCEREYCLAEGNKLYTGQRYIVCDAGGGTVDLATFECTTTATELISKNDHCQLALESGGASGSTILDKNLEFFLKEKIFFECITDAALKYLVDQFVKEIKHYFGGDDRERNNYLGSAQVHNLTDATERLSLSNANIIVTESDTKMTDVVENDYAFDQDYESGEEEDEDAMCFDDSDVDSEAFENSDDEDAFVPGDKNETLSISDYVYFTLPSTGIDSFFLENLSLTGSIITHKDNNIKQLRISHQDIAKHVFDPVVGRVIDLIEQQIKKSRTTIDTLFLLGGFGQSPYLYKQIHQELITNANSINHLIVPEDGYRASMRGGLYHGLDRTKLVPSANYYKKNSKGKFISLPLGYAPNFKYLMGIDFDFFDTSAKFSIIKPDASLDESVIFTESGDVKCEHFNFDSKRFLDEYYDKYMGPYLRETSVSLLSDISASIPDNYVNAVYFNYIIYGFMDQLFQQIQRNFESRFPAARLTDIRYSVSFAPAPINDSPTQMDKLKAVLMAKLDQSVEVMGLPIAIIKQSTFFAENDTFLKDIIANGSIYDYVFAAAKRIGVVHSDNDKGRFLNNTGCLYATFLDYTNRYHVTNLKYYTHAKMIQSLFSKSLLEEGNVQTKSSLYELGERLSSTLRLAYFNGSTLDELPATYALEIKTNENNITGIAGKLTKIESDISNIDSLQESVLYKNDMLEFIKSDSLYWKNMYDEVIYFQQEQSLRLYTSSYIATTEALLAALTIETNFMSMHLRKYLKTYVDLSDLKKTHSIKDLFIDPSTGHPAEITSVSNPAILNTIFQSICDLSEAIITTENILNDLLIPWIKYRLAPALMNTYLEQRKWHRNRTNNYESWTMIISGDIIETKSNSGMVENTILFTALKVQFTQFFWTNLWIDVPYCIYYDANCDKTRYMSNLLDAAFAQQKEKLTRITGRRYAVHFMKFADTTYTGLQSNAIPEPQKSKVLYVDSPKNNLVLYPLIQLNQWLGPIGEKHDPILHHFSVKSECHLSAVLYGSEVDELKQDYFISNNSFKKLHRFIIPIKNPMKPVDISCITEKYSILFTVKQDDYEADFRCNDYAFCVQPK